MAFAFTAVDFADDSTYDAVEAVSNDHASLSETATAVAVDHAINDTDEAAVYDIVADDE